MSENLATKYLMAAGETTEDWDGICGELANEINVRHGGHIVYVWGGMMVMTHGWAFHIVPLVEGLVHDAWQVEFTASDEPLPVGEWLVEMFGPETEIGVCVDGEDVFSGPCRDFQNGMSSSAGSPAA